MKTYALATGLKRSVLMAKHSAATLHVARTRQPQTRMMVPRSPCAASKQSPSSRVRVGWPPELASRGRLVCCARSYRRSQSHAVLDIKADGQPMSIDQRVDAGAQHSLKTRMLATLFGVEETSAAFSSGHFACLSTCTLESSFQTFVVHLETSLSVARVYAAAKPAFLLDPVKAAQYIYALTDAAGISVQQLAKLVCSMPAVLNLEPASVQRTSAALMALLHLQQAVVGKMFLRMPSLMSCKCGNVVGQFAGLQSLLDISPEEAAALVRREPSLLARSTRSLACRLQQLSGYLGISLTGTNQMCCRCPALLNMSFEALEAKGRALQGQLQLSHHELAHILQKRPQLLTYTAERHESNMDRLCVSLSMPRGRVVCLLKAMPQLLDHDAGALQRKWGVIAAGVASCPDWQQQLDSYSASTVARFLTRGMGVLMRLHYLSDVGAQHTMAVSSVLTKDAVFHAKHPGYLKWYDECSRSATMAG
jgi:hypothetical protein